MGWRRGGSCSMGRSGRGSRGGCGAGTSASGRLARPSTRSLPRRCSPRSCSIASGGSTTRRSRNGERRPSCGSIRSIARNWRPPSGGSMSNRPAPRGLRSSPIGCGWVADRLRKYLRRLDNNGVWERDEAVAVLRLLGRDPQARYPDRLTVTLTLLPAHRPGVGDKPTGGPSAVPHRSVRSADLSRRQEVAIEAMWRQVGRFVARAVAKLERRRARLWPVFLQDRAEAPRRAWLPTEVAVLVARHEPLWSRRFHRALRDLRRLQNGRRSRNDLTCENEQHGWPGQSLRAPVDAPQPRPGHAAFCPGHPPDVPSGRIRRSRIASDRRVVGALFCANEANENSTQLWLDSRLTEHAADGEAHAAGPVVNLQNARPGDEDVAPATRFAVATGASEANDVTTQPLAISEVIEEIADGEAHARGRGAHHRDDRPGHEDFAPGTPLEMIFRVNEANDTTTQLTSPEALAGRMGTAEAHAVGLGVTPRRGRGGRRGGGRRSGAWRGGRPRGWWWRCAARCGGGGGTGSGGVGRSGRSPRAGRRSGRDRHCRGDPARGPGPSRRTRRVRGAVPRRGGGGGSRPGRRWSRAR